MARLIKLSPELQDEALVLALFTKKFYAQQRYQHWWQYVQIANRKLKQSIGKKLISEDVAYYLYHKLIPQAYRAFQNIISQGAFISLGFTLIAMFSRLYYLLEELVPGLTSSQRKIKPAKSKKAHQQPKSFVFDGEADLGEPIGEFSGEPVPRLPGRSEELLRPPHLEPEVAMIEANTKQTGAHKQLKPRAKSKEKSKSKSKEKNSKSKSKSKRDEIDDIFGF